MLMKNEVNTSNTKHQIWYAIGVADALHQQLFSSPLTITSMNDGHHKRPSKHTSGEAADLRTKHLPPAQAARFASVLWEHLDHLGYDVIHETDHIHIEWDPKPGETLTNLTP